MSDNSLFMLRGEFDQLALMRFAHASGLPSDADQGYLLHAVLRALFGDAAPKPFAVTGSRGRQLTMLGYAASDHLELVERARAVAAPPAAAALDFQSLCSKPMPERWRAGARYRFQTRVCPVVRISGRKTGEAPREVDTFLHRCWQVGPDVAVDRYVVYREWFEAQLQRSGGARLCEATMTSFLRQRLARRDRSRESARLVRCERPDASLSGTLEVAEPQAFADLLRRGLGRHRTFGFGMLLLSH